MRLIASKVPIVPSSTMIDRQGPLTPALSREGRGGHRGECEGVPSPLAGEGWGEGALAVDHCARRYDGDFGSNQPHP
ncbi:MAG: hypothetical protein ACLP1W_01320, partial [Rhodomicrobium sp.]